MIATPHSRSLQRLLLILACVAAVAIVSWACSSSTPSPVAPTATPDSSVAMAPTATAPPVPTNAIVPVATPTPSEIPPTDTPPTETPSSAPPTDREWNTLGSPDAEVTIADFGDFQ